MSVVIPLELPETLRPFVGNWSGVGRGEYPTIEPFDYLEEISFTTVPGKPFLVYAQRTKASDDLRPLHAESGYWRSPGPGRFEVVLSHPFGAVEMLEGEAADGAITLNSSLVATTSTAKSVTATQRVLSLDGDVLTYRVAMAAVGLPMTHHLDATLHRVQ
ncbi:MAG: FABP family protein [Acidimicrobiia bacterium]